MSYVIDGTDIVISGWENGISDNPYKGLNDMRGVNIVSIPGEVSVSFAQTPIIMPTLTATISAVNTSTNVISVTVNTGTITAFQAVVFAGSLPSGITAGTTYWLGSLGANSFKIYTESTCDNIVSLGTNVTGGTLATVNMQDITYFDKTTGCGVDSAGRAWTGSLSTYYIYLGNPVTGTTGLTNTVGNGIVWYKNYLFVFYNSRICYLHVGSNGTPFTSSSWVNEWNPNTGSVGVGVQIFNTLVGQQNPHEAIEGTLKKDAIFITDANYIAILQEISGSTFDPSNTATYTWSNKAVSLPTYEVASCLAELGNKLLIGASRNVIYTWDEISTNRGDTMMIAENGCTHLLTINSNTFIFAGKRGRVYVTNNSQAQLYVKMPDYISGIEPIFTWKNVAYNKNQIYFGVSATDNAQNAIASYVGLWAIDVTTNALRCVNLMSDTGATVTAVYAKTGIASGFGLNVSWKNGTNYGMDTSASAPYTTYVSYIDTDIIPIGQYLKKHTFENLEFKLALPLVSGEGIKISYRTSRTGSYTQIGETTTVGAFSDVYLVNFDQAEWIQFRIQMKSTASSPSYVHLYELRLRSYQGTSMLNSNI